MRRQNGKNAMAEQQLPNTWPGFYETIVEDAPDALIFADRHGAIRLWNRAAQTLFGYSAAEVMGQSLDLMIPERLRAAHWAGFDKALESGVTKYAGRVLTTRSMHKDGRRLYVDLSFSLLKDDAGNFAGALAIARDATERYNAERELRTRLAELEKTAKPPAA
jgi:PAS domain S-box-containing protein